MIEELKSEELSRKVGGKFKLAALIQRRVCELTHGSRPLVEREPGMTNIEVAIKEIIEGKIAIDYEASNVTPPAEAEPQ